MTLPLLTRPVLRLRADGVAEPLELREPALGPRTVLLSRALCRFERVRSPERLRRRSAVAAARLHALTRAPMAAADSAVAGRGGDFGIWWWDRAEVERLMAAAGLKGAVRLRPEAAAQGGADGWRVVRSDGGYEAQLWEGGYLADTAWRRRPFDAAAWRALTRDAASEPPPAQPLLFSRRASYGGRFVEARALPGRAGQWAAAGAMAALCLGVFFLGQGVSAVRRDGQTRAEIGRLERSAVPGRELQLAARARRLRALGQLIDRPGAVETLADARALLARFGLPMIRFDARRDELSVDVPASAAVGVDLLVEELEASPRFSHVRPTLDREGRRLTLTMAVDADPSPQDTRR